MSPNDCSAQMFVSLVLQFMEYNRVQQGAVVSNLFMIFISNISVTALNWSTWWYVYTSNWGMNGTFTAKCHIYSVFPSMFLRNVAFQLRISAKCVAVRRFLHIRKQFLTKINGMIGVASCVWLWICFIFLNQKMEMGK